MNVPSQVSVAILLSMLVISAALPAQAYIGPGAGLGAIAVFLGVIASVLMAFFAILWYPMKRLFKKRKAGRSEQIERPDQS